MAVSVKVDPEDELTPRQRNEVVADVNLFIALRTSSLSATSEPSGTRSATSS